MNPEIIPINEEALFDYLRQKNQPVMEFDLIKYFIPVDIDAPVQQTLFVKHFSMYYALYRLKFSAGLNGYYLHLDCMRIRLIQIPDHGFCRHYDAETGSFCGESTPEDYCNHHADQYKDYRNSASFDVLLDFYTDPGNITFGESNILKKLMSGIKVYCLKKSDIEAALKLFGIHKPGKKSITARYRELAVIFHPDRCAGSEEMMKKLNSAYAILKEVYIL
jgi:hypothetical protein